MASGKKKTLSGDREIEWSWCAAMMPVGPGRAMDFGNGGSQLGLIAAMKGYSTLAIDMMEIGWRYSHPNLTFRRGDILSMDLEKESFDLVVSCSTVEHVGLFGRYGVERESADGDLAAMARLHELLKPGGSLVMTVPVGRDKVYPMLHRIYGAERLPLLLAGYEIRDEAYWLKDENNRWRSVARAEALAFETDASSPNALENIYGLGCFSVSRR